VSSRATDRSTKRLGGRGILPWGIAAAALLTIDVARAEPSTRDKETARSLVFEGRTLKKAGRTREALERFRSAHSIMNVPTTGIEVAQTLADLGLLMEARDSMLDVSRMPEVPGEPVPYGQAREEARRAVDELAARIPSVTFTVSGSKSASVVVDGTPVDGSLLLLPRKLNPGEHLVVAAAPGCEDKRVRFAVSEHEAKTVPLELGPCEARAVATAPTTKDEGGPGGERQWTTLMYVGFGAAAVGTMIGSVTGVVSLTKTSSVKSRCPDDQCPGELHDDLSSARTLATASNISFGVALVGATLGIVGFVTAPKTRKNTARVTLGPAFVAGEF
jgi:hypothetical protein